MSKTDKPNLNLFVRTIMPDLYEIQKMWDCWDNAINSLNEKPDDSDTNYDSFQEENPPSSD